jgi:hypothetical protein
VFIQAIDQSFVEVAQAKFEADADAVLSRYESGMVTLNGTIVTVKNLMSEDTPTLFKIEG